MANVIRHKRGTSDPVAGDFSDTAELLINTTDGGLFTKTDGGSVVEIGAGGGASELNDLSDAKTDNTGAAIGIGSGTLAADDGTNTTLAIGKDALNDQTSGLFNLGLGNEALSKVTTTSQNVAVGVYAGRYVPGSSNTFVGYSAGEGVSGTSSSVCSYNTGVGEKSFEFITTGLRNTGLGYQALRGVTTGQDNTAIGYLAGYTGTNNLTTGGNNTIIGYNASPSSATVSNEITLGNSSITSLRVPGVSFTVNSGQVSANAYTETVYSLTGTALDPANGAVQTKTLAANTTLTESLSAGESMLLMVDDGSAYAVTWPTMTWVGGSAPTLATSGYSVIELWKVGTTLYGAHVGDVA